MSGFTVQAFEKQLNNLNATQQSIQTLSLWLIHHRKFYQTIVNTWMKELKKVKSSRKLTFMYLANDVIQNSRKKGPEFAKEFKSILPKCFELLAKEVDTPTIFSLDRLLKIWEERNIYDKKLLSEFKAILHAKHKSAKQNSGINEIGASNTNKSEKNSSMRSAEELLMSKMGEEISKSVDMDKYEDIEPEKLIKTLRDLENNSASNDEETRKQIANFPAEIFDAEQFESVMGKDSIENWSKVLNEAQRILIQYNNRLACELENRKKLSSMLVYFIEGQRRSLTQKEKLFNEYREKLKKIRSVREELDSHLKNLPDLSQLPSVTPLPSPIDLFKKETN
ncbi:Regulation of nuclear pre-mRNA domain-containing protein 1B [Sarcoptes scabiei]|uniref:Regulation of nuclear pre-mRNA domain-containing protein 1B n=1 Tax=Sarcoptes scabiei TaxID=52283 RepID=A0A834VFH8_SARSC|nr:Regulation of nuclear pre-mRNA domain-containing protein 1B [Sarcoptes scabiei]UXI19146.1 CCR4-NOT transcription complex subunit 1 [Sarcoptes scabiei]